MMGRLFHGLLIADAVILCAAPCPAHATGPGEKQVSALVGFALAGGDDSARPGMQAGVEATMGFTDAWAGRAAVSSSWQPEPAGGPRYVTAASLGATFSLDVVRWVPFLDLGVSLADLRGGGAGSSQRLGPQVGLGAEYLLSRRWTVAALARFDYFALRLRGPGGVHPWWVCAGLRFGRVF